MNKKLKIQRIRTELKRTHEAMRLARDEDKPQLRKVSRDLNLTLARLVMGGRDG